MSNNPSTNFQPDIQSDSQRADDEYSDTLIVPPPNFQERFQAAQRARKTSEIRSSVEMPNPLTKIDGPDSAQDSTDASATTIQ